MNYKDLLETVIVRCPSCGEEALELRTTSPEPFYRTINSSSSIEVKPLVVCTNCEAQYLPSISLDRLNCLKISKIEI